MEIREGGSRRGCRKVTGHKPSSVAEIVLYASVRACVRVYARPSLLPDPHGNTRDCRTVHEAESCLSLRTFTVTQRALFVDRSSDRFERRCDIY